MGQAVFVFPFQGSEKRGKRGCGDGGRKRDRDGSKRTERKCTQQATEQVGVQLQSRPPASMVISSSCYLPGGEMCGFILKNPEGPFH